MLRITDREGKQRQATPEEEEMLRLLHEMILSHRRFALQMAFLVGGYAVVMMIVLVVQYFK